MRQALLMVAGLVFALAGCEKTSGSAGETSGSAEPGAWLVFEVFQAGTGNGLSATVWPKDMDEDFDTVVEGEAGSSVRFEGIGRRDDGYALPIVAGGWVNLMIWSPGHEMERVDLKVRKGENIVSVELKKTEVEDDRVPETIRLEVLEALPTQGPRSGG